MEKQLERKTSSLSEENSGRSHDNNDEINEVEHHICHQCHRQFKTRRGLMQHQRTCKVTLNILSNNKKEITRTVVLCRKQETIKISR